MPIPTTRCSRRRFAIDFVNDALGPGARAAVELSLDPANALARALATAITAAEREGARVRAA
jgi:hypothetical protein